MKTIKRIQPGSRLLHVVSGGFRGQGTSLHGWCRENGVSYLVARRALEGKRQTDHAHDLVVRLVVAAGMYRADERIEIEGVSHG